MGPENLAEIHEILNREYDDPQLDGFVFGAFS